MMKITNQQLVDSIPALQAIGSLQLKPTTAFRIAKTLRVMNDALKDYNDARTRVVDKHSKRDEDGKLEQLPGPPPGRRVFADPDALNADLEELNKIEIDVDAQPIKLAALADEKVASVHLMVLDWLITE